MKIGKAALLIVVALLALACSSPPSQASLEANRTIELHGLYLVIYDEISALEPTNLTVAIRPNLGSGSLLSIYVKQRDGWYEPVMRGEVSLQGLSFATYSVRVAGQAVVVHSYTLLGRGLSRTLAVPLYPLVDSILDKCSIVIKCAEEISNLTAQPELEPVLVDGTHALRTSARGVPTMHLAWLNITYSLREDEVGTICSKCIRQVYIQPDGSLRVLERLTFTSTDFNRPVEVIRLRLSVNAKGISVSDDLAPYRLSPQTQLNQPGSYSVSTWGNLTLVEVRPRFILRYRENLTFTLAYVAQPNGPGLAEVPAASFYNIPIALLEVYVHPPPGALVTYASPALSEGAAVFSWWPPPVASMRVAYSSAPPILPWLPIASLLAPFVTSMAYLLLKPRREERVERPPALSPGPFVASYEYKLALVDKYAKLLHELAAGELKIRSYERQARALLLEHTRLEAELRREGERLRSAQPVLRAALDELKELDDELARLMERVNQALSRARLGKVTREAFRREVREIGARLKALLKSYKLVLRELSAKT